MLFQDVITQLVAEHKASIITYLKSEIGTHPVYELAVDGKRLIVFQPGVGAPLAAGFLEEIIALGCKKFIACGGAGVLPLFCHSGQSKIREVPENDCQMGVCYELTQGCDKPNGMLR